LFPAIVAQAAPLTYEPGRSVGKGGRAGDGSKARQEATQGGERAEGNADADRGQEARGNSRQEVGRQAAAQVGPAASRSTASKLMRACELAHKREARTRSKITASQEEADMGAAAYKKVVVVALSLMALTVAELGAKLLETRRSSLRT
jgi:hypothetical protein